MAENNRGAKIVVVVLSLIVFILAVALIIVTWQLYAGKSEAPTSEALSDCKSHGLPIDTTTPDVIPPFYDLTEEEVTKVRNFLYGQSDLKLVSSDNVMTHTINSSHIQFIELHLPEKKATLAFLDDGAKQPVREAVVTIIRGDIAEPSVQEYIVGPLTEPSYKRLYRTVSYLYRPYMSLELAASIPAVEKHVDEVLGSIIEESYGGRITDCWGNCLGLRTLTAYSAPVSGEPKKRLGWVTLTAVIEYYTLQNRDLQFLLDMTTSDFKILLVNYAGQNFKSVQELKTAYEANTIKKTKVPYPTVNKELFSTMHRRGKLFPDNPLPPPRLFSPNGQRYAIKGRHISYMGWEFDVRMSTLSGPQLFDIRYHGDRIVYELSLQEVAVFYSGHSPSHRMADFLDNIALLGSLARSLVPGIDCPEDSSFLSTRHSLSYSNNVVDIPRGFCVFEHSSNMPLRRHLNSFYFEDHFFEGMMGTSLVVRTIITAINYDYIFDFIFHQNGAIQVKVSSTGYIIGSFFSEAENDYGFRIKDNLLGNFHTHLVHFKVDLDIHGQNNTFERLDLIPTEVDQSEYSSIKGQTYSQVKIVKNKVFDEKSAAITRDEEKPGYYTFYNQEHTTKHGVPKAYRLHSKGSVIQLLTRDKGNERTISWARYPLAVTKYKEDERRSSSLYATWDAGDPVVNFQEFIDDNDNITNQDLVCWVTLGLHHIPHTEDLPVTPTVGQGLEFYLLPHNYYDEDPAMGSSDSVRIEQVDKRDIKKGLKITEYGDRGTERCYMKGRYNYEDIMKNPVILFEPF